MSVILGFKSSLILRLCHHRLVDVLGLGVDVGGILGHQLLVELHGSLGGIQSTHDPYSMGIQSCHRGLGGMFLTIHFMICGIHHVGKICFHCQNMVALNTFETTFVEYNSIYGAHFFHLICHFVASLTAVSLRLVKYTLQTPWNRLLHHRHVENLKLNTKFKSDISI